MKRICAWCGKGLDDESRKGNDNEPITHGICPDCVRKNLRHEAIDMTDFLNRFSHPVMVVDNDVRILAINRAALIALNKKAEEVGGRLGGEVIACTYARQPGGCGKTVHCKYCTIRNTVADTYKTGKSHVRVPAYADLHHITKENQIRFLISTEKVGDAVLLRIDEMS